MNLNVDKTLRLISASIALFIVSVSPGSFAGPAQFFQDTSPFEITIEGPIQDLVRNKLNKPELPALLHYRDKENNYVVLHIQLKPRGLSRLRTCSFPPIRINFQKAEVVGTLFENQDKLKLVTHCEATRNNRDYVAREYQLYRAYNLLSEYSFRARWLTVNYIDTGPDGKKITEPGFLIEDEIAVAERLDMRPLETGAILVNQLDPVRTTLMSLFQYMIGNIDWSALKGPPGDICCHNFKLLAPKGQSSGFVLLPYDFDQSNFVAAEYAVHNEYYGLSQYQHRYKGFCELNGEIDAALDHMNSIKMQWLDLVNSEPVSDSARRRGVRYIESGYKKLIDPQRVTREIKNECKSAADD